MNNMNNNETDAIEDDKDELPIANLASVRTRRSSSWQTGTSTNAPLSVEHVSSMNNINKNETDAIEADKDGVPIAKLASVRTRRSSSLQYKEEDDLPIAELVRNRRLYAQKSSLQTLRCESKKIISSF